MNSDIIDFLTSTNTIYAVGLVLITAVTTIGVPIINGHYQIKKQSRQDRANVYIRFLDFLSLVSIEISHKRCLTAETATKFLSSAYAAMCFSKQDIRTNIISIVNLIPMLKKEPVSDALWNDFESKTSLIIQALYTQMK